MKGVSLQKPMVGRGQKRCLLSACSSSVPPSPWQCCGQGDGKGWCSGAGETWQRELLQAFSLSNVIKENKPESKIVWLFPLWCSFLCPGGEEELRTVTCQKLNVCLEIRMLYWNTRSVLQIYLSRKVPSDSL